MAENMDSACVFFNFTVVLVRGVWPVAAVVTLGRSFSQQAAFRMPRVRYAS